MEDKVVERAERNWVAGQEALDLLGREYTRLRRISNFARPPAYK
jgi:hypothetical protein